MKVRIEDCQILSDGRKLAVKLYVGDESGLVETSCFWVTGRTVTFFCVDEIREME